MAVAQSSTRKPLQRKASKRSKSPKSSAPKRPSKSQRISAINTQHGVLAALSPIAVIGLAVSGFIPWEFLTETMSLALIGNLVGYGFRRFNP